MYKLHYLLLEPDMDIGSIVAHEKKLMIINIINA